MLFSIAEVARLVWIFVGIATPTLHSRPIHATISPNDNRIAVGCSLVARGSAGRDAETGEEGEGRGEARARGNQAAAGARKS